MCFRAKAHLVFHWYLYNKIIYYFKGLQTKFKRSTSYSVIFLKKARENSKNYFCIFIILQTMKFEIKPYKDKYKPQKLHVYLLLLLLLLLLQLSVKLIGFLIPTK